MTEPTTPSPASVAVDDAAVTAAIALLDAAGYLIAKVPPCKHGNHPHGRHSVITRSAMCPGSDPLPHGFKTLHRGSWGYVVFCQCGSSFADYHQVDGRDGLTAWDEHKQEHGIDTSVSRPSVPVDAATGDRQ